MIDVAIIVLAAGASSRMGSPKQLLQFKGRPLVLHIAQAALDSAAARVVVVTGSHATEVGGALAGLDVCVVENTEWREGMGTSIKTGLAAAELLGAAAIVIALCDQPFVLSDTYTRLIATHEQTGAAIVASSYANTVGVPALFAKSVWPALHALGPDQGCKSVIVDAGRECIMIDCPQAATDMDTPEDFAGAADILP